ncbi:hypothetical protein JCM6882_007625 [Rhodosporidiobolus microsporus]
METSRMCSATSFDCTLDVRMSAVIRSEISHPNSILKQPNRENYLTVSVEKHYNGVRILWTASDYTPSLSRDGISAAELFWVDEDGSLHLIRDVFGQFFAMWPDLQSTTLSLSVFEAAFVRAEATSGGRFQFNTHSRFLARLFFLHPRKQVPPVKSQPAPSSSLELATRLADLNDHPTPFNVRLVFPRTPSLELWTTSHLLSSASGYFRHLFASDFSEATKRTAAEHEAFAQERAAASGGGEGKDEDMDEDDGGYDSDSEADDLYASSSPRPAKPALPPPELRYHEIRITEASYATYRALLCFLQTGHVAFAPLASTFYLPSSSSPSPSPAASPSPASAPATRLAHLSASLLSSPLLPLPTSPKSLFSLAHFLDIPALAALALSNFRAQLTPQNALLELFLPGSGSTSGASGGGGDGAATAANKHDALRGAVVQFVKERGEEVRKTKEYGEVLGMLRSGEVRAGGAVVAELVPLLLG